MSGLTLTTLRGTINYVAGKYGSGLGINGVPVAPAAADSFLSATGVDGGALATGTVEAWVSLNGLPPNNIAAVGHDQWYWLGSTGEGYPIARYGSSTGGETTLNGTVTMNDGAFHHLALVFNAGVGSLYQDGVRIATSATVKSVGTSAIGKPSIRGFTAASTTDWKGTVDEVRFSNVARYTGTTYAVPTAAFPQIDANTIALYHLDGDGVDSAGLAAGPTIGTVTIGTAGTVATITYPAPVAGSAPVGGVSLYEGTTAGGEGAVAVATNTGAGGGTFTRTIPTTSRGFYFVRAFDTASTPIYSAASNEVATPVVVTNVAPNDAAILYSPYNWDLSAVRALAVNAGAYFRASIDGSLLGITLNFDMANVSAPVPQIRYRLDQGPWVLVPTAATVAIPIPTDNTWNKHVLDVVIKSAVEQNNRWASPQNSVVKFTGLAVQSNAAIALSAVGRRALNVLVYADSIGEGVRTLNSTSASVADQNDSTVGWAYLQREALGAEVGVVGFGRQGMVWLGNGGVPAMKDAYALIVAGIARSFTPVPDIIVINHGTNDGGSGVTSAAFQTAYVATANALLAATPDTTQIAIMMPFSGVYGIAVYNAIAAASSTPKRVSVINTAGWYSSADSSDGTHPYGHTNVVKLAPKLAAALRAILGRGSSYLNVDGAAKRVSSKRV